MPDFDIENLKKTWQKQEITSVYDQEHILKILSRKSKNYVKYILWISILEVVLAFSYWLIQFLKGEKSLEIFHKLENFPTRIEEYVLNYYYFIHLGYFMISLFFVYQFYQKYKKIKIYDNLHSLIQNIIQFRKKVEYFVLFNFVIGLLEIVLSGALLYGYSSEFSWSVFLLTLVVFMVLVVLYYWFFYGWLLKKINGVLQELNSINSID